MSWLLDCLIAPTLHCNCVQTDVMPDKKQIMLNINNYFYVCHSKSTIRAGIQCIQRSQTLFRSKSQSFLLFISIYENQFTYNLRRILSQLLIELKNWWFYLSPNCCYNGLFWSHWGQKFHKCLKISDDFWLLFIRNILN